MRNAVVLATLWYLGFGFKFVICTAWVDGLTRFITETSEFKQVKILTRLDKDENWENPLCEELLAELMQKIPTMLINFGDDFKFPVNSVPDDELGSKTPIDTSASLFLMLIESPNGLPTPMTERFLDTVAVMANYQYSPKYLIVSFVQKQSNNIKELLEYAWSKKMLDLTIVELAEPKIPKTSILIERSVALPIVHYLNSFKNEYTAKEWTADLNNFFPDKVKNLWGHPLTISTYEGRNFKLAGNALFQRMFERYFNLSLRRVDPSSFSYSEVHEHVDLSSSSKIFRYDTWDDSLRTSWMESDGVYFVVPISFKPETSISADFFIAISLSISVVFIFWIVIKRLGMISYPWRPFNIGRVFFGISISHQPRPTAERILFTSLLAIFVIYSSIINGAITGVTVQKIDPVEFNTLEDLADSPLIFYGTPRDIQYASHAFADLRNISKDRLIESSYPLCLMNIAKHENMSCMVSKKSAINVMVAMNAYGTAIVKLAGPCLVTESFGFKVGRRSPYRSSFDKFILRAHSTGLIDKIFNQEYRKVEILTEKQINKKPEFKDELHKQLIVISIIGYGLSILVFVAEIIYHRIFIFKKSKVRPLLPLISSRKAASRIKVKSRRLVFVPNDKLRSRMAGQPQKVYYSGITREELRVEGCSICN